MFPLGAILNKPTCFDFRSLISVSSQEDNLSGTQYRLSVSRISTELTILLMLT